jgi:Mg-chelatase subunit ChlD
LMMTGGPNSFGFGAWYRTPVENILPVNTDLRTEVELPLVALVIVLDRSQSMSTGNPNKLELAKEGAISVVDLAYQDDLIGLIVFSDAQSTEWAFKLRRATDQGKREMLAAILTIETSGGTVLQPAYEQALQALQQTEAAIKHVIILSDGKLYDGGGAFGSSGNEVDFKLIAGTALRFGVTTSTIAIGDGADFERLSAMARAGGGRYYEALDVSTLPQIFTNEALTATRSLLREESFNPQLHSHPLVPENAVSPPALNAYIATTMKPTSEIILEGLQSEPILAVTRQGLGRSAALTTDLNLWAGELGQWSDLPGLLGTVTRWLQEHPADYAATVTREGTQLHIVVDAVKDGEYINDKSLELRYAGLSQGLEQVAPGRYEGYVDSYANGGTLLVVDGDDVVAREQIHEPHAEFDKHEGASLMQVIAERSGGEVLSNIETYAPSTPAESTALWHYFALAGMMAFLLELVLRRFLEPRAKALK